MKLAVVELCELIERIILYVDYGEPYEAIQLHHSVVVIKDVGDEHDFSDSNLGNYLLNETVVRVFMGVKDHLPYKVLWGD